MNDIPREPQNYLDNMRWAREHSTYLHQQFENVWVAIVDKQVVAVGENFAQAKKVAAAKTGKYTNEIYVEFIESVGAIYDTSQTTF